MHEMLLLSVGYMNQGFMKRCPFIYLSR